MHCGGAVAVVVGIVLVFIALILRGTTSENFMPIMPLWDPVPPTLPAKFDGTYISYQDFPYSRLCTPLKEGETKFANSVKDCLPGEVFITDGIAKACQCSIRNLCMSDGIC